RISKPPKTCGRKTPLRKRQEEEYERECKRPTLDRITEEIWSQFRKRGGGRYELDANAKYKYFPSGKFLIGKCRLPPGDVDDYYTITSYRETLDLYQLTSTHNMMIFSRFIKTSELVGFQNWIRKHLKARKTKVLTVKKRPEGEAVIDPPPDFYDGFSDDIYAYFSAVEPECVHFKSRENGRYIFTFVPMEFILHM
ncbi:hypothetical protein RRG08_036644, partial [Elysia crispata]